MSVELQLQLIIVMECLKNKQIALFYTVLHQSNYYSSVLRFVECVNSPTVLLKIRAHVAL